MKKILASLLALCLSLGILAGCGNSGTTAQSGGKKTFVFGDTTFNAENEEPTINPHEAYSGWACIRYGVGETLMKIADDGTVAKQLALPTADVRRCVGMVQATSAAGVGVLAHASTARRISARCRSSTSTSRSSRRAIMRRGSPRLAPPGRAASPGE